MDEQFIAIIRREIAGLQVEQAVPFPSREGAIGRITGMLWALRILDPAKHSRVLAALGVHIGHDWRLLLRH